MEKYIELQKYFADFIEKQNFDGQPSELYDPIKYTILQKGKRMRPVLCLLACDLFGGNLQDALYPALALETFHNFTLIHDDIMDQAPIRRGLPTVYQKWNSSVAILSGDTMFAMAFQYVMRTNAKCGTKTGEVLMKVAREVCEGQQFDLNFESQAVVSIDEYLKMIRLKTAVLLAASLEMGAVIAGADEASKQQIYDFGIAIGMAFQLQDDILDCYSDQQVFGKMMGGDIVENKKTYLYLKALELATGNDRADLETLFSDACILSDEDKIMAVKRIYDRLNIKQVVEGVMSDYFREAEMILDRIAADDEKKTHLRQYADYLYGRNK